MWRSERLRLIRRGQADQPIFQKGLDNELLAERGTIIDEPSSRIVELRYQHVEAQLCIGFSFGPPPLQIIGHGIYAPAQKEHIVAFHLWFDGQGLAMDSDEFLMALGKVESI